MTRFLAAGLAVGVLVGCSGSGPQQAAPDVPSISYRHAHGQEDQVRVRAERFCGDYGRRARHVETGPDGNRYVARFDCV